MSCFGLVLFSSGKFHNGTYCVGLEPVLRTGQSRVSDLLARSKHVTFALTAIKSRHIQLIIHENGMKTKMINLCVRSSHATVSVDQDDKPLVQPASRSETVKRESASIRRVPDTVTKEKRTSSLARSICHTGTGCVRNFA